MIKNHQTVGSLLAIGLVSFVLLAGGGCVGTPRTEARRLKAEIGAIRETAGELDPTIKVLVVFLAQDPGNRTLAAMNEPRTLYLATVRFVTVLIKYEEVTIRYRQHVRTYSLAPDQYIGYKRIAGGKKLLEYYFLREISRWRETIVVADLELNPIESAEAPILKADAKEWTPDLIEKYGKFLQEDYEKWIAPSNGAP